MKPLSSHREILHIAAPSILTNITIPLLGLVDVAIVGHLGENEGDAAPYIGAIAVGGLIFNMIYWLFGFLRMGTSGMTAQAFGKKDKALQIQLLVQASAVAIICGALIFLLQIPIIKIARLLIAPSDEVWRLAVDYFNIRIWAAPAALLLFSFTGWFVGMQNSVFPLYIAIGQNLINLIVSALLVFGFGWDVKGVALGTVVAQYVGLAAAIGLWFFRYDRSLRQYLPSWRTCFDAGSMQRFFSVNRDIFLRTLCLVAVTSTFTAIGARQGDMQLAVNTLLIQLFLFFSYFTDGFALAGEALAGKYIGAKAQNRLYRSVRDLFLWCGGIAVIFSILYAFKGNFILSLLTDDPTVVGTALDYLTWSIFIPIISFAAFAWDGIFIGATATRPMLLTLGIATIFFFATYFGLPYVENLPFWPFSSLSVNHRLWMAFTIYLSIRSLIQTILARKVLIV